MTLSQQDKKTLKENWEQAKTQIKATFPDLDESSLGSEPDVTTLTQEAGLPQEQVEAQLHQIAQQYSQQNK